MSSPTETNVEAKVESKALLPSAAFQARPLSYQSEKPKVLFIDDSRLIRAAAIKMFAEDYELILAENGREAWAHLQQDSSIEMVFTDLVMPELDGFELLSLIRTSTDDRQRQLPVVVVTGADNSDDAKVKAYNMGATSFLTKPFDSADVNSLAQAHISSRKVTEQLQEQTLVDPLTGLINRRGFSHQLDKDISFSSRHSHQLTVLDIEIDVFKDMFVRIGRGGAEKIIRKVASVISEAVRKEDTVARSGLASFSVSLPAADPDYSLLIAHRIGQTVGNFKARHKGKLLPITVSSGACVVEKGVFADTDTVLNVAAEAKGWAMSRGLNQVHSIDLGSYRNANIQRSAVSVDDALEEIRQGGSRDVMSQINHIIDELKPLFNLMTDEQRQRIIQGEH